MHPTLPQVFTVSELDAQAGLALGEVGGKAEGWRRLYGQQVITAAVLSGVFRVGNLVQAQDAGVFLFWSHDLAPLHEFARKTCA